MSKIIKISLPDGSVREMPQGSTPADVAAAIGPGLAKAALAARVDGELVDLALPFTADANLALVTSHDEAEALELARHEFAHVLAEAVQALRRFAELGGELVDSSPMYGSSEAVLGEAAEELNLHKKLFLATKVWTSGRTEGVRQMETSLRRMRVSLKGPLDLMQVHNLVDVGNHLATLAAWKKEGRVRYVGITHYTASAHAELERMLPRVDFLQVNYSLAEPQAGTRLLAAAATAGVAVIINRPFAEGEMFARVKAKPLPDFAGEIGCTSWAQVFLKWILANPAVTCVIPGTRSATHVADNLGAARGALPDAAMRKRIEAAFG